jgi:hypothetical protein
MYIAPFLSSITLSSVACLALPYFFKLSHKRHDFRKNFIPCKIVFSFSLQFSSEVFLIRRRIQRDIIINVHILLSTHIYYHQRTYIIINVHILSSTYIYYHQLTYIIINVHILSSTYTGLHVKCSSFLSYFNHTDFSRQIF